MVEKTWTEAEADQVKTNIVKLYSWVKGATGKYQRNLGRYVNNGKGNPVSLDSYRSDIAPGYNILAQRSPLTGNQSSVNVLKSAVDTVVSKMSQARVRPFFDATNGDYKTIRACRNAQAFFDAFFDSCNVYKLGAEALRDGLIFDKGILWIDDDTQKIRKVLPWQVGLDPAEWQYGGPEGLTHVSLVLKEYPVSAIRKAYPDAKIEIDDEYQAREFWIYWDLKAKRKWYAYDGKIFRMVEIDYTRAPFVWAYWNPPVKGYQSTSLIDENYTIQVQIDELMLRIDDATRNSLFNTVYVPMGSDIKVSKLDNGAGLMVPFNPGPSGGAPVVSTPPPISNQYIELYQMMVRTIYENSGISQLSAQSKKPAGIESGRALETLADIESERFNLTLQNYIGLFIELARVCIDVFPGDSMVLPETFSRRVLKWNEIKRQRDAYSIQFSAASALSKDPTQKMKEIDALVQRGYVPKEMAAQLMEIPDIEGTYSAMTAAYDYAQTIIERAAEKGELDYLPITDLNLLFSEALRWMLRLAADESNGKYIANLKKLIDKIDDSLEETEAPEAPPGAGPAVPAAPVGA